MAEKFPIDLNSYKKIKLDPSNPKLTEEQKKDILHNIQLFRDTIIFFTAVSGARGCSGHTGGPYDTSPEVVILEALFQSNPDRFVPIHWDEAGHRVATQYLLAAIHGDLQPEALLYYREEHKKLPGHPELGLTPGVKFSSGRLGHMWPYVNGVAISIKRESDKKCTFLLGSDGSQQEGDDAEAARLAVAKDLPIKLILDDNDVTIAGHPSEYLKGYNLNKTMAGHGLKVLECNGEDIDALYASIIESINTTGPVAIIAKRKMMVGVKDMEGSHLGHEVIPVKTALAYLEEKGRKEAVEYLKNVKKSTFSYEFIGSTKDLASNRNVFGESVVAEIDKLPAEERAKKVMVIDSDLEGSCGLKIIHQKHPEVFISSGIMERGNFSAAAGFGFNKSDKQGIFATFAAFLEMIVSEATMARLNFSNVICHFSHSGIDEIADNTCHFGVNNFFADNGLEDSYETKLYFVADANQMRALIARIFHEKGMRFVFTTRSQLPYIYAEDGKTQLYSADNGYKFVPGKDEVVREGKAGYIVSYGDILYRALDAVERLKKEGIDVGLINKPTLNVVDEDMMKKIGTAPFVFVAESLNRKTGLGVRLGTWLLERGLHPKYGYIGAHLEGCGGIAAQVPHQGLDPIGITKKVKAFLSH